MQKLVEIKVILSISKSMFTLDANVNPTVWSGLVSGPAVGIVTLTLQF